MASWLLVIESNCIDPGREQEFNDWYNNVHIPDIFETKCFVKAARYELPNPPEGKGKYLAVYEIESDDLDRDMALHGANMKRKEALGRITDLIRMTSRCIYKKVASFPQAEAPVETEALDVVAR
jgi:hypothetical protein